MGFFIHNTLYIIHNNIWNITIDEPFKKEFILEINEMIKYSSIDHKNTFYLVKERYFF